MQMSCLELEANVLSLLQFLLARIMSETEHAFIYSIQCRQPQWL